MINLIAKIPPWFSALLFLITLFTITFFANRWLSVFFIIGILMALSLKLVDWMVGPDDD